MLAFYQKAYAKMFHKEQSVSYRELVCHNFELINKMMGEEYINARPINEILRFLNRTHLTLGISYGSTKVYLNDSEFPRKWYNLAADMPRGFWPPLAHDRQLIQQRLEAVFPKNLIEQEMSTRCWIDIPREIASLLYRFRPSPLCRAVELEQFLQDPGYKFIIKMKGLRRRQP